MRHRLIGIMMVACVLPTGCRNESAKSPAELTVQLQSDDAGARARARESLATRGEAAVPALVEALRNSDAVVALSAADALGRIGATAVPALTQALQGPDVRGRAWAAFALGRIGPPAKAAIPALEALLREPATRGPAQEAIDRIRR